MLSVGTAVVAVALAFSSPWPTAVAAGSSAMLALAIERFAQRWRKSKGASKGCERTRSVLDALREAMLVVDADGIVVMANPAARRVLRNADEEAEGQSLWSALGGDLGQHARHAWDALHDRPRPENGDLREVRRSGIPWRGGTYDLCAAEVISPRTGEDFGTLFLLVDSTRTHELQRLKDQFLSSVSHELRTPLTNICAYSEILRSMPTAESEEWPEFVRVVHEEGVKLSALVDEMFDCLRLESGEAQFDCLDVDAAQVTREVVGEFEALAALRSIALGYEGDPDKLTVTADRDRLAQVVRNLVENAVKFTPDGGAVRVTTGRCEDGWEVRVDDSGPGVPEAHRSAVFEKFSQLSDHLTAKSPGAGLGLASSRAIVARFGGLIWCEESPLGGACFGVRLPQAGHAPLTSPGVMALAGAGAG
jgi:signal transduction histidine kinase